MIPPFLIPILAKGLDLVANAAMAKGKDWIKDKTGIDVDKASLSEAEYAKLRQFEMDHQEELLRIKQEDDKLDATIELAYLQDGQSARNMQMAALQQTDEFAKRFVYYFAIFWAIVAMSYVIAITFITIPQESIRFADTVLGFLLGTVIAQVVAFFYGSSRSSQLKDDTIRQVVGNVTGGQNETR